MSKRGKSKKGSVKKGRQETPLVVYVWVFGLALTSYIVARIALGAYPHPVHWGSGIAGGVVGYFVGWLWYHKRGDVI